MEPGTQMGPLVSDEQFRRVTGFLESGKSDGATALAGGGRFGDRGYFVEPTVLTNTRPDMKVVREEIFGPVLVASPFTDLDEIASAANDSEYGLGAGIWTRDISKAHALAKRIRAGTVWINCYNVFDAALPFGGYKQSGGAAKWAIKCSRPTPKSRPSPPSCKSAAVIPVPDRPGPAPGLPVREQQQVRARPAPATPARRHRATPVFAAAPPYLPTPGPRWIVRGRPHRPNQGQRAAHENG
jgi:Aldehyde dehydrogenase family